MLSESTGTTLGPKAVPMVCQKVVEFAPMDEDTGSIPTKPVSKSEIKRLIRQERWLRAKKRRKATPKEKMKAPNARRIAEGKPSRHEAYALHQTNE